MQFANGEVKTTGVQFTVTMDDGNTHTFDQYGAFVSGKLVATSLDSGALIDIAQRGFVSPGDKLHRGDRLTFH